MRADVCAVEWDGDRHISVTIDIYCYICRVESFELKELVLDRSLQRWQDGWCGPRSSNYEPRPDLARRTIVRARQSWDLWEAATGKSLRDSPAVRLFYDPDHEVFDRREDIAKLVAGLVERLDMNRRLAHHS